MSANGAEYRHYYADQLEAGCRYQDFVCRELHRRGIVLQNMTSKKYQSKMENLLGMEIKFDQKMGQTGNVYIETHEKANPNNTEYVESGILRDDTTWLYAIGDRKVLFIFGKNLLRGLAINPRSWMVQRKTDTSRGFTFPVAKARALAEKVVEFEHGENVSP